MSVERAPPSSKSFDAAWRAASVVATFASATATDASAIASAVAHSRAEFDRDAGAFEQCRSGLNAHVDVSDFADRQRIVDGFVDPAVRPRARATAHECDRVAKSCARNAEIDGRVHDLADRA